MTEFVGLPGCIPEAPKHLPGTLVIILSFLTVRKSSLIKPVFVHWCYTWDCNWEFALDMKQESSQLRKTFLGVDWRGVLHLPHLWPSQTQKLVQGLFVQTNLLFWKTSCTTRETRMRFLIHKCIKKSIKKCIHFWGFGKPLTCVLV